MVEVCYNLAVQPAWSTTACSIYSCGPGQLYYKPLDHLNFLRDEVPGHAPSTQSRVYAHVDMRNMPKRGQSKRGKLWEL